MAIENKEDLIKKLAVLEAQLLTFKETHAHVEATKKEVIGLKKTNEEVIASEHNLRQLLEKVQLENQGYKKQVDTLKGELTKLATLFDEYINAYQDQVKMLGVFLKNTQTVEKYLSSKIEEFNGGNKK
jgi:chromosome segregation ATPase